MIIQMEDIKNKSNKIKAGVLISLIIFSVISLSSLSGCIDLEVKDHLKEKYTITFYVKDLETDQQIYEARIGWRTTYDNTETYYTDVHGKVTITDIDEGTYEFFIDGGKNLMSYDPVYESITLSEDIYSSHNLQINVLLAMSYSVSSWEIIEI